MSDERHQLLDTGGGIKHAIPLFDLTQPILIHNVDIISDIDLRNLYVKHLDNASMHDGASPSGATLAVHQRKTSRYLQFTDDMRLCGWTNVKTGEVKGELGEAFAFAGIHVVDPSLLPYLLAQDADVFSIIDFYLKVCNEIAISGAEVTGREWVDCGKHEALAKAAQLTSNNLKKLI